MLLTKLINSTITFIIILITWDPQLHTQKIEKYSFSNYFLIFNIKIYVPEYYCSFVLMICHDSPYADYFGIKIEHDQKYAIYFIINLPSSNGFTCILVVIDSFTKMTHFFDLLCRKYSYNKFLYYIKNTIIKCFYFYFIYMYLVYYKTLSFWRVLKLLIY